MNKEHEVTLEDKGILITLDVEWAIEDESHDWEQGDARGTRELYSPQAESFDIKHVTDLETGEETAFDDHPDNARCPAGYPLGLHDEIMSLLNDGQCAPEPPDHGDFKREAEEEEGERRAEEQREREHYGD